MVKTSPVNIKAAKKKKKKKKKKEKKKTTKKKTPQDLCWKVLDPAHLLFFDHRLCVNYVIAMLLLASCMSIHNQPLYFA